MPHRPRWLFSDVVVSLCFYNWQYLYLSVSTLRVCILCYNSRQERHLSLLFMNDSMLCSTMVVRMCSCGRGLLGQASLWMELINIHYVSFPPCALDFFDNRDKSGLWLRSILPQRKTLLLSWLDCISCISRVDVFSYHVLLTMFYDDVLLVVYVCRKKAKCSPFALGRFLSAKKLILCTLWLCLD